MDSVHEGIPRRGVSPVAPQLLLASASPRRAELLSAAGFQFDVLAADVDETPRPDEEPAALARRLALAKARAVAATRSEGLVLGGDTVVAIDGVTLGKPEDSQQAAAMLRSLSGRVHQVFSGVALVDAAAGRQVADVACSRVRFDALDSGKIAAYLETGEWRGKAGAYAIQGVAGHFASVETGQHDTVVGLPVGLVRDLMDRLVTGTEGNE